MVRAGEIEHGRLIAERADSVWNWASPAGQLRARRRAELIQQAACLAPEMHVLELGCGTGLFTEVFARTGCRLKAVDISESLLDRAYERVKSGNVELGIEDAENLSFADETFDAVVGSSILHHLDLQRAIVEIRRVLKPGGRIAFAEPNMMNPQIALQRNVPALRRWAGESPEETAYFRRPLAARLREFGFLDVTVQPFDFLHPATPRPLIPVVRGLGRAMEHVPMVREIAGSLLIRARRASQSSPRERTAGQAEVRDPSRRVEPRS